MESALDIYIDRLAKGEEVIDTVIDPAALQATDPFLSFNKPVHVTGRAYLAENFLLLHFNISSFYSVPCKICSEWMEKEIVSKDTYLTIEIAQIPSRVFHALAEIRELLFLAIDEYHECIGGCPQREKIQQYFTQ